MARDRNIKLLSAREITNLQPVHHHRNGVYTHTAFTLSYSDGSSQHFSVFGKPKAEAAMQRLRQEGAMAAEAMSRRDANVLYPLDPLFEARTTGFQPGDDPSGPLAKSVPGWTGKIALIALGLATVLAPITFGIRNLVSNEVAFQVAESVYEYEAYVHGGWRHIDEVKEEYLPRAKLKEAVQKPNVTERIKAISENCGRQAGAVSARGRTKRSRQQCTRPSRKRATRVQSRHCASSNTTIRMRKSARSQGASCSSARTPKKKRRTTRPELQTEASALR